MEKTFKIIQRAMDAGIEIRMRQFYTFRNSYFVQLFHNERVAGFTVDMNALKPDILDEKLANELTRAIHEVLMSPFEEVL